MPKRETTEWEDALIKAGIREAPPEEPKPEAIIYDIGSKEDRTKDAVYNARTAAELDELEVDMEDDEFFEDYKRKRMAELQQRMLSAKYGKVRHIGKPEYAEEVTEVKGDVVVVMMFKPSIPQCQLLERHVNQLAEKFPMVKFVKIYADAAVENYPDRNLPTLIVYQDGNVKGQVISLRELGDMACTVDDIEWALSKLEAVESDLRDNPREKQFRGVGITLGERGVGDVDYE